MKGIFGAGRGIGSGQGGGGGAGMASANAPSKGGGILSQLMGGREFRYNRLLDKLNQSTILFKVPAEWGADENNVVFGTGGMAVAAAATGTSSANAPRDLILRKLILINQLDAADVDFTVTAITVEGNSLLLGSGLTGAVFQPNSFHSPHFDIPVAGGTPVAVTVSNGSAAGQEFAPCFTID